MPTMRPRFNFMWFWAIVGVVIIGYSMFGSAESQPVDGEAHDDRGHQKREVHNELA